MTEGTGYLHAYDDDLGGALSLVVADLSGTALDPAAAESLVWRFAQEHTDFSGRHEAGGEIALVVAERVQEHLMEDVRIIPWPECLDHRGTHPLWLNVEAGPAACWTCRDSGLAVELGRLTQAV